MRIKWVDETSYSHNEPRVPPRTYAAEVSPFQVVVTRWIYGEQDVWYFTVEGLWQYRPLKNKIEVSGGVITGIKANRLNLKVSVLNWDEHDSLKRSVATGRNAPIDERNLEELQRLDLENRQLPFDLI